MDDTKTKVLGVLEHAADVYNCRAILDDAVNGADADMLVNYVEYEREMLATSICNCGNALKALGESFGIGVGGNDGHNPSYEYMRKSDEESARRLELAREYDRGYDAGMSAKSASENARTNLTKSEKTINKSAESEPQLTEIGESHNFQSHGQVSMRPKNKTITSELRRWASDNTVKDMVLTTYPEQHAVHGTLEHIITIADRIDEQFAHICEQYDSVLQATVEDALNQRNENKSVESSKYAENHKSSHIADELRECVNTATKTYDDTLWYEMGDDSEADHTICHITEAELLGVADRIDTEFARICQQQDDDDGLVVGRSRGRAPDVPNHAQRRG